MNYQIITQNDDCPQTHINVKTITKFLKTKGIDIVEASANKLVINCMLFDVSEHSLLSYLSTFFPKENLMVYGCIDPIFKKDWKDKVGAILSENDLDFEISSKIKYTLFENPIAIKINTGCNKGRCSFCRLAGQKNTSYPVEQILNEFKKYSLDNIFVLFSNDCGSYEPDLLDLVNQILTKYPDIKLAINTCNAEYFLSHKEEFKTFLTSGKIVSTGTSMQSGSREILKDMNRPDYIDEMKETLKDIKKDLPKTSFIYSEFMFGYPGETEEDLRQSLELAEYFTHVVWYRYFQIKHTLSACKYPRIKKGTDYSKIITKFAREKQIKICTIESRLSVLHNQNYSNMYQWMIKK